MFKKQDNELRKKFFMELAFEIYGGRWHLERRIGSNKLAKRLRLSHEKMETVAAVAPVSQRGVARWTLFARCDRVASGLGARNIVLLLPLPLLTVSEFSPFADILD
jgi:hypothetical protein